MIKKIFIISVLLFSLALPVSAARKEGYGTVQTQQATGGLLPNLIKNESGIAAIIGKGVAALLGLIGVIFFILIFYAGVNWMTAQGSTDKIDKSKKILLEASIGLVIVMGAYAITNFVLESFSSGAPSTDPTSHEESTSYEPEPVYSCEINEGSWCMDQCSEGLIPDTTEMTCPGTQKCCVENRDNCASGNGVCENSCTNFRVPAASQFRCNGNQTCCVEGPTCVRNGGRCLPISLGCDIGYDPAPNETCESGRECCMPQPVNCTAFTTRSDCTQNPPCRFQTVTNPLTSVNMWSGCVAPHILDSCLTAKQSCDGACRYGDRNCTYNCSNALVQCLSNI